MMTPFESLFGVPPSDIQKNVLLLPLLPKGFLKSQGLEKLRKGRLFASENISGATLVQTGMGASFVGDAVLYLKETSCKNIFLFGSCGALHARNGLKPGSCVLPEKCVALESFTEFLLEPKWTRFYYPDRNLLRNFLTFAASHSLPRSGDLQISKAVCATVSSIKLEEERCGWFTEQGVDIVDMECSAFFSAASFAGLSALTFFYISDVIKEKPFYEGNPFQPSQNLWECFMTYLCGVP